MDPDQNDLALLDPDPEAKKLTKIYTKKLIQKGFCTYHTYLWYVLWPIKYVRYRYIFH